MLYEVQWSIITGPGQSLKVIFINVDEYQPREDVGFWGITWKLVKILCKLTAVVQQLDVCFHTVICPHFQSHIDTTCVEEHLTYGKTHTVLY
jgi:hypothetical protein